MTGQMRDRPKLSWTTEPGALYTVVLSDEALEAVLGIRKASLFFGGRSEKRLGRSSPPQNSAIGGSMAL